MSFKIDGNRFKERGRTIATISGNRIKEGSGGKTLARVVGGDLREGIYGRKLKTIRDIDKNIDGTGGDSKAALWLQFIR